MNCKQGDMAIIVRTAPWNDRFLGMIVKCVGLNEAIRAPAWITDPPIVDTEGDVLLAEDEALKPLRGDLLNDEITNSKEQEAA